MSGKKWWIVNVMWLSVISQVFAQDVDTQVKLLITAKINTSNGASRILCANKLRCSLIATTSVYNHESANLLWSHDGVVKGAAPELLTILTNSYQDGLNPADYHIVEISNLLTQINNNQLPTLDKLPMLADLDKTLTDAFLLYARHMVSGRVDTLATYPKWSITKRQVDLIALLRHATDSNDSAVLKEALNSITPTYFGYTLLKQELAKYQAIVDDGGLPVIPPGATLKLHSKGSRVKLLQQRLEITGEYFADSKNGIYDNNLKAAVKLFQANNGLKATGVVNKETVQELNRPVSDIMKTIALNMDRLRYLPLDMGSRYLLVNIPDFSLVGFDGDRKVLKMPVIVGKSANRSCVLSSKISYVEINPYWSIPDSIARKEILPKLQESSDYTIKQQINVYIDSYNTLPIDPLTVNWKKVDPANMPYKFRQLPGDKNALGHIKFIFPNPCGIYLHDTPTRNLFDRNRRDFSHGCIRVGSPLELATYLLEGKPNWTAGKIESQIASGKRQVVFLNESMNINIIYATAWVDQKNQLQLRNDIYKIDAVDYPLK